MRKKQVSLIWKAIDNCRASGVSFEQSTLLVLYTLPLKWVELSDRGKDVFENMFALGDLALTFGKRRSLDELRDYVSRIEDILPGERGHAYTEEFIKRAESLLSEKKGDEILREIFLQVDDTVGEKIEILNEIAIEVLDRLLFGMGRGFFDGLQNMSVARLQGVLADCQKEMSVYDGFCGTGLVALETADIESQVILQDINHYALSIAVVMCLLSENNHCTLNGGDSLTNAAAGEAQFDRVVCEIPVHPRYDAEYIREAQQNLPYYIPPVNGDTVAIAHVLNHLKEDGKAVVMVPASFLYKSGKTGLFREWMASNNYIKQVIELPGGFSYHTSIPFALLVISKKKENGDIFLINAKNFFYQNDRRQLEVSDEGIRNIVRICSESEEIDGISKIVDYKTIANNEYNMTSQQYVESESAMPVRFTEFRILKDKADAMRTELQEIEKQLDALRKDYVSVS